MASDELFEESPEAAVDRQAFGPPDSVARCGTGPGFAQPPLDGVEVSDLAENPAAEPGVIGGGLQKLAANVCEAGGVGDGSRRLLPEPGPVGGIAVGLEQAGEILAAGFGDGSPEDGIEAVVGAAGLPVVENEFLAGRVVGPEVAGLSLAGAGLEVIDGRLVSLDVAAFADVAGHELPERTQQAGEVVLPVAHQRAV